MTSGIASRTSRRRRRPWTTSLRARTTSWKRATRRAIGWRSKAGAQAGEAVALFGIGLVLAIVVCFLLANSLLFRHPRTLVADFFGARHRLSTIREYIFHRVQVHLGFLFLLLGFGLQLFGHYRTPCAAGEIGRAHV